MVEVKYEEVSIGDLYKFVKGTNKINKKIINVNKGEFPVYSGSKINDGLMGFINFYDFDGEFIRIITVGKAGKTSIIRGRFSLAQNNGVLIPKNPKKTERILNEYLKIILKNQLKNKAKGTDTGNKQKSLTNKQIIATKIKLPINSNGDYDIKVQKEIVKKYEIVEEKKKELKEKLDYFKDVQVDFMATEISNHKEYNVSEIFNISLGDGKYTKSYATKNIGEFPLYSGQTDGEYANIDSYDYDGSYLTWAKDGLSGYIIHHNNEKFSITNHRGILKLKDEFSDLNLEYLKIILEPIFRKNIKGRLGTEEKNEYTTLSKEMIIDIKDKIKIPISEDGTFDLEKQKQIVSKHKAIEEMKKSILEKGLPFTLSDVQFDGEIPYIYIYIYIRLRDLFDIQRGKSIYTKTYCKNNKGDCPVYSADNNKPLGYTNKFDYDGRFLTSSINGIAGVLTIVEGKFSTNADRVVFIPKVKNINLEYVKHILEPILRNINKGRKGLKGKNEFTKLTPKMIEDELMPIPYDMHGEPFIQKQNIISSKYKKIEMIKEEINENLNNLLNFDINF